MTVLELDRVTTIRGAGRHAVHALRDVTLQLRPGEFVLLGGPSGAGKTLLGVAAGLLTPTTGRVALVGHDLAALTARGRRSLRARRVGFVFQRSHLLARLSARENVTLMGVLADGASAPVRAEAARLLEVLGITWLEDRHPRELSGGEEQRVPMGVARSGAPCGLPEVGLGRPPGTHPRDGW